MRYPASEKLEIIRIVEQSHLPARRTLEQSELSPRELAVRFTDEQRYFVSEATVYRLLKPSAAIPTMLRIAGALKAAPPTT